MELSNAPTARSHDDLSDLDAVLGASTSKDATSTASRPLVKDDLSDLDAALAPQQSRNDDLLDLWASLEDGAMRKSAPSAPLTNTGEEGFWSGLGKGVATATIKGAANIPGMFGNIREAGKYLADRANAAILGMPVEDVRRKREEFEKRNPGLPSWASPNVLPTGEQVARPVLSKTGEYEPESTLGRLGMAGLETAIGGLGPGAGGVMAGTPLRAALGTTARMAPGNFAAGVASQGAADLTGDPLAGLAAGAIAPGLGSVAKLGAEKAMRPMLEDIPGLGRRYAGTREGMAGELLLKSADNPEALKAALSTSGEQGLAGSPLTLGQKTGDLGILQAERRARTADNTAYNQLEADQNAGRRAALEGISSQGADVSRPSQFFNSHRQAIERVADAAEQELQNRAAMLAGMLGPQQAPESIGATIRDAIEHARGEAKKETSALYKAIDPEGTLAMVAAPIRKGAASIIDSVDPYGVPLEGAEARILEKARDLPEAMPFRSVVELEKDITDAMKQERRTGGETATWGRLSALKGHVQDAINNAIDNQHAYEQAAVARGEVVPEHTIEARLQQQWNIPLAGNLARDASGYRAGDFGASPRATFAPSGRSGADVPPGGGFPKVASDQGISPQTREPNFDEAAASRLMAAKSAYSQYAKTYKAEPVAGAIRTTGFSGDYRLPSSALPSRAVVRGDRGYETAGSFLKAAKDSPDALSAMQEAALNPLRSRVNPDGTLPVDAIAKWKADYSGALRAIDEKAPGFSKSFDETGAAADKLAEFAAARKQERAEFEKSAAARFLNLSDPRDIENRVGQMMTAPQGGVTQMRQLVKQASADPAAIEGLRKAGVDWITRRLSNVAEAGASGEKLFSGAQFQKLIRDHEPTLSELFKPEQVNTLRAIARDMELADRSVQATRTKGSPGSAKDILPFLSKNAKEKLGHTSMALAILESLSLAHEHGGIPGVIKTAIPISAAIGFKYWRGSANEKVQNLFKEALLDPNVARQLLSRVKPAEVNKRAEILSNSIRRGLIANPSLAGEARAERANGGRVGSPPSKAERLIARAGSAKDDIARHLVPLMHAPDDLVASALRMAQR